MSANRSTNGGAGSDLRPKRMRLGTRSCAECRRRKVKCIFPENAASCQGCQAHHVVCRPQEAQARETAKPSAVESDDPDKAALQRRLEELEGTIRHICGTVGIDANSATLSQLKPQPDDALARAQPSNNPAPAQFPASTPAAHHSGSPVSSISETVRASEASRSPASNAFEDAPLANLFKSSMFMGEVDRSRYGIAEPEQDAKVRELVRPVASIIPSHQDLRAIFQETNKYWPIWPPCYAEIEPPGSLETVQQGGVPLALNFVSNGLQSGNAAVTAKALIWLSLCVHQLPPSWISAHVSLPAAPRVLKFKYLQTAQILLCLPAENGDTIDSVEARLLQHRVYLDVGMPRKAWLAVRHALNAALVLGLHRRKWPAQESLRANFWPSIVQYERHLSCLLGLPTALPDWHPGLVWDSIESDPVLQLNQKLCVILGALTERDQSGRSEDYAATVKMDQEWERSKSILPADCWDHAVPPNTPFPTIYRRHLLKLHYYATGQLIHLPYLHKATTDRRYEISRLTCLECCREIVKGYETFRNGTPDMIMCELIDFSSFSAAAIIAINLLNPKRQSEPDITTETQDWKLVGMMARDLGKTSSVLDCVVAKQGAQLLDFFLSVHNGTYNGPEKYDAAIPYFGRVQISCGSMRAKSATVSREQDSGSNHFDCGPAPTSPVLDFSSMAPFNFEVPFDFDFNFDLGMELQTNWTMAAEQWNIEWAEKFGNNDVGMGDSG